MTETNLPFADQVFHQFLDLRRFMRQFGHRFVEKHGIKPRDLAVLLCVSETGKATIGQIQAYLHQSASTTSALVAKLEKSGLVTRTRHKEDNRVVHVALTSAGRHVIENTPLGGLPLLRRNMRQLPKEQLVQINETLVLIMQMMAETDAE